MNTFLLLKTMKNAFFFSRMRFLFVLIFEKIFGLLCAVCTCLFTFLLDFCDLWKNFTTIDWYYCGCQDKGSVCVPWGDASLSASTFRRGHRGPCCTSWQSGWL